MLTNHLKELMTSLAGVDSGVQVEAVQTVDAKVKYPGADDLTGSEAKPS